MVLTQTLKSGLVALSAIVVVSVTPATAQEAEASASHLAAARAAVASIGATQQFDEVLLNTATEIKAELIANNPNLENELSDMVDDEAIELAPRRADLENEIARIYARLFTEEELTAISEFYGSPAGAKLIEQGPLATREMVAAARIWANGIARDLRVAARESARALSPAAAAPAGQAPAPAP